MPGTSIQTLPNLLYQGILVGFYVNDLAEWGRDSVLHTERVLRGDGRLNLGVPGFITPEIDLLHKKESITVNITFDKLKAERRRASGWDKCLRQRC